VALQYASGQTATFTMTAFNNVGGRKTRIFGTRGELYLNSGDRELQDGKWIVTEPLLRHFDFLTESLSYETIADSADTELTGHHFGDYRMMQRVIGAMKTRRQDLILSGPRDTLRSHLTVFAAERSRREGRVVYINELYV
jgi:predicted dehydrogenase